MFRKVLAYILLTVGVGLLFTTNFSFNNSVSDIIHDLESDYHSVTDVIQDYVATGNSKRFHAFDESRFYVEIFKGDSIIYWNKAPFTQDRVIQLSAFGDSLRNARINLDMSSPIQETFITYQILENKHPSDQGNTFTLDRNKFELTVIDSDMTYLLRTTSWFFIVFGLVLLFVVPRFQRIESDGLKSFIVTALTPLIIWILAGHVPVFTSLFHGFPGYQISEKGIFSFFTLADYFLLIIIAVVLLLAIQKNSQFISKIDVVKHRVKLQVAAGFIICLGFAKMDMFIKGFVMHSQTNLEIENMMKFDLVSFGLVLLFILSSLIFFIGTHLFISKLLQKTDYKWLSLGWILGFILVYSVGMVGIPWWFFISLVISYTLILDTYIDKGSPNITYLLWWIILFSGFISVTMYYYGVKKDMIERDKFLKSLFYEADASSVLNLEQYNQHLIRTSAFQKISSLDYPAKLDADDLQSFLQDSILKGLPESYTMSVEMFDFKGSTMLSHHYANYEYVQTIYNTSYNVGQGIKYQPFTDTYILKYDIANTKNLSHFYTLYILFSNDKRKMEKKEKSKYSYTILNKEGIIQRNDISGSIPSLQILQSTDSTSIKQNFSLAVYKPNSEYKIISYRNTSTLLKPISLFSFIFTIYGLLILCFTLLNTKYKFLPQEYPLKFGDRSSLKTKIQLSIIALVLVGFLIIGLITGFYFKNLIIVNQSHQDNQVASNIITNIRSDINQLSEDADLLKFISMKLPEYSQIHNKTLSLYNANGKIISYGLHENVPQRIAYQRFENNPVSAFRWSNQDLYSLAYFASKPFGYLGILRNTDYGAKTSIFDFMSTILNAYIFLFLIAGALAITISNSITQPLSILTEKLKGFKLGKKNESLEWNSNDEIGILIKNYNNLTDQLEKSAGILAKTERDMAWREMAKQVAHEIKNPLTPMKLSIQYLEKSSLSQPERAAQLIPRISNTLIEQIDNLTQIANEFSNFATMPTANNEKVALNEIVEAVHDLFRKREDMDINMIEPIDELYVFADKNHLVRILNNLLKNAIQAIPEQRRGKIEIELTRQNSNALIRISDNGTGIPDHMKDKVFTPNFTTKSSGTGLGLAICANMIESFNGKIFFETKPDIGTDFFISIPLMRSEDHYDNGENRITLD